VDFGIRGLDLAYVLLEPYEAVVLVDALPRGGQPGTLYVLEPEQGPADPPSAEVPLMEPHNLDPARVLRVVAALGGPPQRLIVVGCEPDVSRSDEMSAEISAPVRSAVGEAVRFVESLVERLLSAGDSNGAAVVVFCEENSVPGKEDWSCHP
jgi:hydrogenase maturation protease